MIVNDLIIDRSTAKRDQKFTVESVVYADPIFENWKRIGQFLSERQLSQDEIIDLFKRIEQGQAATGTNRTVLGKGKDFAANIGQSVSNILGKIQDSAPVAAVDVAYDQATDAVANMMGGRDGDKSKIMDAIKKYRLLVKAYPKTAGFAKAALVAIAGFATGGAGLPAIAGLTYALDSAIRGDKLSSVLGKGTGAAALSWAGQKVAGMVGSDPAAAGDGTTPDHSGAAVDPGMTPDHAGVATPGGGTYTIQKGDQLGYIAQANGNTVKELMAANPQIDFSKALQPGQQLNLPSSGPVGVGSVWKDYPGGVYGDKLRESFAVVPMSLSALIDHKRTRYQWRLNEHQGRPSGDDVVLSHNGIMHILEQTTNLHNNLVEFLRKKDTYRADMPQAPTDDSDAKPGYIGRTLNWLDRAAQTVGRQLTNKVTAEKLKMNWHQFGKPFDSDQLATWLMTNQKISPEVVSTVYSELGLPMPAAAAPKYGTRSSAAGAIARGPADRVAPAAQPQIDATADAGSNAMSSMAAQLTQPTATPVGNTAASSTGGTTTELPTGRVHRAKTAAPAATTAQTTPAPTPAPAASKRPSWADPMSKNYVGRREVARRMAAQPTAAATPNYGQQQQGYGAVTYKTPGSQPAGMSPTWTGRQPAAAKPMPKTVTGGATPAEYAELDRRIKAAAAKQPVSEQLTWSRNWDPSRLLIKQLRT